MTKHTRAIHLDFHTPEGVSDFGRDFSASDFADTLRDANVLSVTAFAQCNFGYAYYDTKIGVPYPGMKGDMLSEITEECHKRGIEVNAYINIGINNVQADKHLSWCRVNEHGSVYKGDVRDNQAARSMCYNTGYRDFLLSVIKEVTELGTDGIFCDCMGYSRCYCPHCIAAMKEQGIDIRDNDAVLRFAYDSLISLAHDIRAVVPENKNLVLSGIPYDYSICHAGASHLEIESLPGGFGGWSHDYIGPQAAYARNLTPHSLYMSGRFHASWGDFGGTKEKASMQNDLYDALVNNIGFAIGDHMNPSHGLIKSVYKTIGEVFEEAKMYEARTEGAEHCAEIGIVRNKGGYNIPFLSDELYGSARILTELGHSFDIINEDMAFDGYKVLILPDCINMTPTLAAKLKIHISEGKGIISSAFSCYDKETNRFLLDEYNFIKPCGLDNDTASCYRLTSEEFGDTSLMNSDYSVGIFMKAEREEDVIAKHIGHYFDDRWDRPYFDYRWTTEHLYTYLPPDKETGYDSVIMHDNICHIGFEIFSCYHRYAPVFHKRLLKSVIDKMLPTPMICKGNLPSTAKIALSKTKDYKILHIKVTYPEPRGRWFKVVEEHNVLPEGETVKVRGEFRRVRHVPDMNELQCEFDGVYTQIKLPKIVGYAMFILD